MSRIGRKPVDLPANCKVSLSGRTITVESGSNRLSRELPPRVSVRVDEQAKQVIVERESDERESRAMHGLARALIANMVHGVTNGYQKELEVTGVGWSVQVQGQTVVLNVGYADAKKVQAPAGVKVEVNGPRIKVSGIDKQAVGQTAAEIRSKRKPEPYKGKGIKYADEQIVRKQGKAFAAGG